MAEKTVTFHIDMEVASIYVKDLLSFTYKHYLLPHPEQFNNVMKSIIDGDPALSYRVIDPETQSYVDVQVIGHRPIKIRMTPSDASISQDTLERLREDLVVSVELFEERVRRTTLYFSWVKGEKIIPERLPSTKSRATHQIFTGNMLYLYVIMMMASIFLFSILGSYAPLVIIGFQLLAILFSDKITLRLGEWRIDSKNPEVHLLQYHLPVKEFLEFQAKYGADAILRMKSDIYERSFSVGNEPSCEVGEEIFSKYGMKCDPERMTVKTVNVYDIVKRAAEKFNIPTPKIAILNTMLPNAAATGPSPGRGAVLVTTGLLVQLEEDEVFSVIGHEMGHLKGRDPLILFGLMAAEYLLRVYVFLPFLYFSPLLYLMIAMGVIYFIAKFFEARADLQSAMVIGQPQVLAEALTKIGFHRLQFETMPGYKILGWINWDPHPPIYFRVNRLENMKTPVRVMHPLIQSAKDTVNGLRAAL